MLRTIHFFMVTVKPTVQDFLSARGDIRRAHLATLVLCHMADYWALDAYEGDDRDMRECLEELHKALADECPEFLLIKEVADASKHAQLLTHKKGMPRELSFSERIRRPSGFTDQFVEGKSDEATSVMATLLNGTTRPLAEAVQSVLFLWEKKLKEKRLSALP
ncbi:MAG: hypothetical protein ABI167_07915 [Nitrosospira sp.]